jgi:hypothetical protein
MDEREDGLPLQDVMQERDREMCIPPPPDVEPTVAVLAQESEAELLGIPPAQQESLHRQGSELKGEVSHRGV